MYAVASSHSVDTVGLKLMGSESESFVQPEAAVEEVDLCQSNRGFSFPSSSTGQGNSYFSRKVKQPELILDKNLCGKPGKDSVELSMYHGADATEPHDSCNNHIMCESNSVVGLQQKAGKVPRASNFSRRQDVVQLKDRIISEDVKDISTKLGSHPKFSLSPEKAQSLKQKNNFKSKRADKIFLKVSTKSKCDSFSIKAGSGSIHSAASAASNFFGGYGLKSDIRDITKLLVDDLPLKDLLGGTNECPSLSKDVPMKEAHDNKGFLQSVRKACSILQLPRLLQSLNIEADSVSTKNISACNLSVVSVASGADGDLANDCMTELSSCNKESCSKVDIPANPLEVLLYKPHDISELLALPPPKDLDSLLQEATKPSLSAKSAPDMRSGKQLSRRASLPPFQWSHSFSGHSKSISDSAKLSASRSSCPGRWSRLRNFAISRVNSSGSFINLESLTYNQSLVPLKPRMAPSSLDKVLMDVPDKNPQCSWKLLSSGTSSKASFLSIESGGQENFEENGEQCPVVVGAARTLFDIATHSSRQNINEIARWPKKTSQKAMKARKLKSNENPGEALTTSNSESGSDYPMKNTGLFLSSKKPRLENKKDDGRSNYRKGLLNWSTKRSSQLSPSKLSKDSTLETIYSTVGMVKQSCTMPPPALRSDKTFEGQKKVRKLTAMEWRRGKERID